MSAPPRPSAEAPPFAASQTGLLPSSRRPGAADASSTNTTSNVIPSSLGGDDESPQRPPPERWTASFCSPEQIDDLGKIAFQRFAQTGIEHGTSRSTTSMPLITSDHAQPPMLHPQPLRRQSQHSVFAKAVLLSQTLVHSIERGHDFRGESGGAVRTSDKTPATEPTSQPVTTKKA
ncbi:hypothetical protein BU16DRAFT_554198 [Lophium mytilinum]|uniref:Uncharacterized protein n=1 Tax=Lophium mytilinum TaxID=390894 RepID=A0A6A6RBE6_9PEZI|nr:hypothetical protein BU16DRAFT_554198 [Lophium mytilinum]